MINSFLCGVISENKAGGFLTRMGFKILKKRYRTESGEIDIIAEKNGECHFIEVKNRKNLDDARNAISKKQMKRIVNSAEIFLEKENLTEKFTGIFFDAIFVSASIVSFLENAWDAWSIY